MLHALRWPWLPTAQEVALAWIWFRVWGSRSLGFRVCRREQCWILMDQKQLKTFVFHRMRQTLRMMPSCPDELKNHSARTSSLPMNHKHPRPNRTRVSPAARTLASCVPKRFAENAFAVFWGASCPPARLPHSFSTPCQVDVLQKKVQNRASVEARCVTLRRVEAQCGVAHSMYRTTSQASCVKRPMAQTTGALAQRSDRGASAYSRTKHSYESEALILLPCNSCKFYLSHRFDSQHCLGRRPKAADRAFAVQN